MRISLSNPSIGKITAIYIILMVSGFPISAVLSSMAGIDSVGSYAYRVLCLLFLFYLIGLALIRKEVFNTIPQYAVPILLFWLVYYSRIIIDVTIRNIPLGEYDTFYTLFFATNTLFSVLASIFFFKFVDYDFLAKWFFNAILLTNILLVIYILYTYGLTTEIFQARLSVLRSDAEKGGQYILNPITFGFVGQQLMLISVCQMLFSSANATKKRLLFAGFCLGLLVLVMGGSRGPLFSAILIALLLLFLKAYLSKSLYLVARLGLVFFLVVIGLFLLIDDAVIENIEVLRRIFISIENIEDEERVYEYTSAWNQFLSHPILGDRFVTLYDQYYPHNIFLEVPMATGLVGALLFTVFFVTYLVSFRKAVYFCLSANVLAIFTLSLTAVLTGMTSSSLFLSPDFWMLIIAVIHYLPQTDRFKQATEV